MEERTVWLENMEYEIFNQAPEKYKKRAMKYILLMMTTRGLKGNELKAYLWNWNLKATKARVSMQVLCMPEKFLKKRAKLACLCLTERKEVSKYVSRKEKT